MIPASKFTDATLLTPGITVTRLGPTRGRKVVAVDGKEVTYTQGRRAGTMTKRQWLNWCRAIRGGRAMVIGAPA